MKPLYILKIGGSVATHKDKLGFSVRTDLLKKIALSIKKSQTKKDFDLILIHGAGSVGHQLVRKYNLNFGLKESAENLKNSLKICHAIQKLDNAIFEIFISHGVNIFPIHTASTIIQKDKGIIHCHTKIIDESLAKNCIPILYGEMVFDKILGMSPCSGDAIASFLAKKFRAQKIFFASDINGIFNMDPHLHKDAKLIENINLSEIWNNDRIKITGSHSVDVTGGLLGKIKSLDLKHEKSLQSIEIFNGLQEKNYEHVFLAKKFPHTTIKIK
jgi:isopentenyl phosphate kinase